MKKLVFVLILVAIAGTSFLAFSHRILPADSDECQRDVTHAGHVSELPPFHCIGHTEFDMQSGEWDHIHPWMTEEWMAEHEGHR